MAVDRGFDLLAMAEALNKCDENIRVFEAAIERERVTKAEYRAILEVLQRKLEPPKIHLELAQGDDEDDD